MPLGMGYDYELHRITNLRIENWDPYPQYENYFGECNGKITG
jgi:hypothetical protein